MRAQFYKDNGTLPDKVTVTFDEGFKLLEELRDMTKERKPYEAMTRVLISRDEKDLIEIFKGSKIFGMTVEIETLIH